MAGQFVQVVGLLAVDDRMQVHHHRLQVRGRVQEFVLNAVSDLVTVENGQSTLDREVRALLLKAEGHSYEEI